MKIRTKYLFAGIVFGFMFPIGAILFEAVLNGHLNIIKLHMDNKLMFMIDSAPIFLGAFAYVGGIFQEKSSIVNDELSKSSYELQLLFDNLDMQKTEMIKNQEETLIINDNLNETLSFVSKYIDDVLEDISELDIDIIELHDKSSDLLLKSGVIKDNSNKSYTNHQLGNKIMDSMSDSVKNLDDELKKILETIDIEQKHIVALSKNLGEINSLKTRIESVSDEIDLLALNASIEAARVGDAGRGFAVVASEIKKLSLESQDATSDMASYLENITSNFSKVSDAMTEISTEIFELDQNIESTRLNVTDYKAEQLIELDVILSIQDTSLSQEDDVYVLNNALSGAKKSISHLKQLIHENKSFLNEKRK